MATGAEWRVGDAEREAVAEQLREHYAAGRLTIDEFRSRLDAAYRRPPRPTCAGSPPTCRRLARARPARRGEPPACAAPPRARPGPAAPPGTAGRPAGFRRPGGGQRGRPWLTPPRRPARARVPAGGGADGAADRARGRADLDRAPRLAQRAWLEAVPVAVGMPWLGRVIWLARAALVGRAFWRVGERAAGPARPPRLYQRHRGHGYALYQGHPGGEWHQARVGDLSGTTR